MIDDAARDITFADILMCYGLQPEVALEIAHEFGDEDVDCWFTFEARLDGRADSMGYFGKDF